MTTRHAPTVSGRLLVPLAIVGALLAGPARADLVSPGELSRAHEKLEGLQNCTKCHPAGKQFSTEKCLECHKELRPGLAAGKGFHGRLTDKRCEACHHEHHGREFPVIDWGDAGQKSFDHAKTGYPLTGKHAKASYQTKQYPMPVVDPPW